MEYVLTNSLPLRLELHAARANRTAGFSFDSASTLSGTSPSASLNALRADDASNLHQLVSDVALNLFISPENPAVYQPYLERVLAAH